MKRALVLLFAVLMFGGVAHTQNLLTGKKIYGANCKAVVEIEVNGNFSGAGFIVSADGIIMTANHVVTTRESRFRQYANNIRVLVEGHATPFDATPLIGQISDEQVNYDSALIKITASQLPTVKLGSWSEADIGDHLTILPSWPGMGCIALEAVVAKTAPVQTVLGSKPVNTIVFQSPVRNGFSGSPVFSPKGNVIAIVDTKVFGISVSLDELRKKWLSTRGATTGIEIHAYVGGVDIATSFLEMINNLDQNLISGLGTGVAIDYAKQLQAQTNKK
jgi:S1-C subfamily serine protease